MYQALYRKYRPLVFGDVVGQEHITETLKGSLEKGKVFHAYLFTGTRGTGKTTCAKILAKAVCCEAPVNGEPCGQCASCKSIAEGVATDISEIDAASNNSVNDIRDLKEQVSFLPVALKYRVYIIDEVHMLSTQAFNALLKTLEEPPAHVVFILATTEVHKLPATILSRCQRFDFHRLEPEVICRRIETVANAEGFTVTPGAALKIAALADGGMRDALSILDQCSACNKEITEQVIADVCGIAGDTETIKLVKAIGQKATAEAISIVDKLYRGSVDMKKLIFELVSVFRNLMIIKTVKDSSSLIICSEQERNEFKEIAESFTLSQIIENLSLLQSVGENISVAAARSDVELTIVRLCTPELQGSTAALTARIEALERAVNSLEKGEAPVISPASAPAKTPIPPKPSVKTAEEEIPLPLEENEIPAPMETEPPLNKTEAEKPKAVKPQPQSGDPVPVEKWPEILELVKKSCPLMAGVLAGSRAYIGGGRLLIDSKLNQFKELINSDAKYRDYIRNAAEQVLGVSYNLGPYKPTATAKEGPADPMLEFKKSLELAQNS